LRASPNVVIPAFGGMTTFDKLGVNEDHASRNSDTPANVGGMTISDEPSANDVPGQS